MSKPACIVSGYDERGAGFARILMGLRNKQALDAANASTTLRASMHHNRLVMNGDHSFDNRRPEHFLK